MSSHGQSGVVRTAHEALMCKQSSRRLFAANSHSSQHELHKYDNGIDTTIRENGIKSMESKMHNQSPLLDIFYFFRCKAVDNLLNELITATLLYRSLPADLSLQIVVLGCGMDDSHFLKLTQTVRKALEGSQIDTASPDMDTMHVTLYEIDFQEVIQQRHQENEVLIQSDLSPQRCVCVSHALLSCDLEDANRLIQLLSLHELKENSPTIFLAECVLDYIPTTAVSSLLQILSRTFRNSLFLSFDLALSSMERTFNQSVCSDGFAAMMKAKFSMRGAPLRHILPDKSSWERYFIQNLWPMAACWGLYQLIEKISNEQDRNDIKSFLRSSVFDEYSSLALLLQRYVITTASNDPFFVEIVQNRLNISMDTMRSIGGENDPLLLLNRRIKDLSGRVEMIERSLGIISSHQVR